MNMISCRLDIAYGKQYQGVRSEEVKGTGLSQSVLISSQSRGGVTSSPQSIPISSPQSISIPSPQSIQQKVPSVPSSNRLSILQPISATEVTFTLASLIEPADISSSVFDCSLSY